MIPDLRKVHYPDRLKQLNLPTLTYRMSRGDMIETYKLLTGKYDPQVALTLPKNVASEYFTRGNSNKLLVKRCGYDLRTNFFSNRMSEIKNLCVSNVQIVHQVCFLKVLIVSDIMT